MSSRTFEAMLGGKRGDRATVEVPFDVVKAFGSARAKVKAIVNGVELQTIAMLEAGTKHP